MNLAIIGYGKMGKAIEEIALERGHQIAAVFDITNPLSQEKLKGIDAAIEFSQPNSVVQNIKICAEAGVPVVVVTTGWYDHFEEVQDFVANTQGALLPATNFSLGVNITFFINKVFAKIMSQYPYTVGLTETHHTQKLDTPSGTAISLGEGIVNNHSAFTRWNLSETHSFAANGSLPIQALR